MFTANAAWLTCAGIAHNLLRGAAALASDYHATARSATLRRHAIGVPARLAHRGRDQTVLHLPEHGPGTTPGTGCSRTYRTACHAPRRRGLTGGHTPCTPTAEAQGVRPAEGADSEDRGETV